MPFAGPNQINDLARKALSAAYRGNQWECVGTEWNAWEGFFAGKLRGFFNAIPTLKVTPLPRGSYRGACRSQ